MRRLVSGSIVLASLVLAACGNKDNIQAGKRADSNASAPAAADSKDAPGSAAGSNEGLPGDNGAIVLPKDIPSETDDGQESVDQTPTGLQPTFKLGGPPPGPPTSGRFKEGVHYQKIVPAQPTSVGPDKVEVLEVFWYGCGGCYALDPAIDSWRAKMKPAYVEFVRLPAMWNEALRLQARVFYTAELLGRLDELHALLFREVNVKGNPLDSVEKIGGFFREHGVSTDDFQKAFSSTDVEAKMQRADLLNRRLRIQTAPSLVINGKYRTSVELAGGEQQLFTLIGEVANHEHGG
jgi:protein dithiol oxidoreductase (disulfide-forming)